MEIQKKNILPSPFFKQIEKPNIKIEKSKPCLAVPQGDLLPMGPPMYGPRGATIPPRFLGNYQQNYGNHGRNQQNPKGFRNLNNHQGNRFQNRNHQRPIQNYQQDFTQQFWCETCDRPFNTSEQLESHKYEHQICGIDDCMFIGHPSVVAKHIEAQHTTGLYKKIKNIVTPEEITKWREERIKRYPTRANVELRQKAQAERKKRGEKLSERKSKFGQQNDRRQMDGGSKVRNTGIGNDNRTCKERNQFNKNESNDKGKQVGNNNRRKRKRVPREKRNTDTEKHVENIKNKEGIFNGNLKMFEGTLMMVDHPEKVKNVEINALTSLLTMYGSSSESDTNNDEHEQLLKEGNVEENNFFETAINNSDINTNECDKKDINMLDINTKINYVEEKLTVLEQKKVSQGKLQENIDSDDIPDEEPIARKPENELLPTNALISKDQPSTSKEQSSHKCSRSNRHEKSIVNKRKKYNTLLDYSKLRTRRQNTMLEKLLESDIRHERNVLLQCVRYVVKNDFFEIGQNKVTN